MALIKYATRMILMDHLISMQQTGSTEDFARKLRISRRQLLLDLGDLKTLGVKVKYSRILNSYRFEDHCGLNELFRQNIN